MKKCIASVLLVGLLLFAASGLADTAYETRTGVITGGPITLMDGVWAGSNAVGTLLTGAPVLITAQSGDMFQVFAYAERAVGWIQAIYVIEDENAAPMHAGVVISQSVSLREAPSTGAKLLLSIPNGAVIDIFSESNGWYAVRCWDEKTMTRREGYLRADFVVQDPAFVTTTQSTYVYAMPSRNAKKVGQLVSGTQLVVIGEFNDFWVVNLRTASGFIYKADIQYDQVAWFGQ